jgi:uncharacterized protein DUF1918
MAAVGDRVQVPSKRVGQTPREGVVTGVSGVLLRVTWSGGEESTIFPSMGSVVVVGKVRAVKKAVAKKAASTRPKKKATDTARSPANKRATVPAKKSAKSATKKVAKKSAKSAKVAKKSGKPQRPQAKKSSSKRSGRAPKRRK